jgi:sugar transferase (PEP-CTERM/EpsH1 system associated)
MSSDGASSHSQAQPGHPSDPAGKSRRPLLTAKRILLLTPQFPYPPHQGTTIRNYNLIAGLAERHEVHLLSFGDPAESTSTPLHRLCSSVEVIRPPQRSMRHRLRGLVLSTLPDMALRLPSADFQALLDRTLDRVRPDVLEVEGIEMAQYLLQAAERRGEASLPLLVFDDHNAEYVLQQRAFETDARSLHPRRWIGAAYSLVQWRRLRRYERRACRAADRVVAVSEADAQALRRLVPGLEPVVVPNGVDMAFYSEPVPALDVRPGQKYGDRGGPGLVFTGKMDFRPNVDAVLWFARHVLPLVRRNVPDAHFWVVGRDPHPRLAPLAGDPAVTLTGWVPDVRPYISAAAVYVVPLRIGGGTRLKVLEAMAMGKAIVSTALGCEGFDVVRGREVVLGDTPGEFAAAVVELLRDPGQRERLGHAAHDYARARYDWPVIVPQLEAVYTT